MEIKAYEVYTVEEAQSLLKISRSTILRLIKKGALHSAKVGVQYRIMGRDILHLLSPELDRRGSFTRKGGSGCMRRKASFEC